MSNELFALDGAVALITGAGSGIGRATALMLGSCGARIVCTDILGRAAQLQSLVAELRLAQVDCFEASLDVSAVVTMPALFDSALARFGRVDILVNNAGAQLLKPALDFEEDEFDRLISVNLKGAFFCAQAAAAIMIDQGGGTIINVASQHGVVGNRLRSAYCASKGGLVNLTRALAVEWAEYNIRVNSVSPTFVDNGGNAAELVRPQVKQEIETFMPLKRAVTAREVAAAVCYLASPQASMVTGHNLLIDGGWTAR